MDTATHQYYRCPGRVHREDLEPLCGPGVDGQRELIAMMLVPHAKITIPQLPSEFVKRVDLCAYLEAGTVDVGLLCAPAGYGKTLLLADWTRTSTATDTA